MYVYMAGGFASYLLGLNRTTYELSGVENEGNNPGAIKEPGFGWMTGFLFVVCFVGLFVLIPLRKVYFTLFFFLRSFVLESCVSFHHMQLKLNFNTLGKSGNRHTPQT